MGGDHAKNTPRPEERDVAAGEMPQATFGDSLPTKYMLPSLNGRVARCGLTFYSLRGTKSDSERLPGSGTVAHQERLSHPGVQGATGLHLDSVTLNGEIVYMLSCEHEQQLPLSDTLPARLFNE